MHPLTRIKLLHTFVWAIMAASILFILYSGVVGEITWLTWFALVLALGESLIIVLNKWACPLTPLAAQHTTNRAPNFDIYLPVWLAKNNKEIFGPMLAVGILLVIWRLIVGSDM